MKLSEMWGTLGWTWNRFADTLDTRFVQNEENLFSSFEFEINIDFLLVYLNKFVKQSILKIK